MAASLNLNIEAQATAGIEFAFIHTPKAAGPERKRGRVGGG